MPIMVFNLLTKGNIARASPVRRSERSYGHDWTTEHGGTAVIDEALFEAEEKMEKAITVAKDDLGGIRTGRANAGMFNRIVVDYYGSPTR